MSVKSVVANWVCMPAGGEPAARFRAADVVVTMGCGDACPIYPGKRYEDWDGPTRRGGQSPIPRWGLWEL